MTSVQSSRCGDAYMEVRWPTGMASGSPGVVIGTVGAGLLCGTMCGIIVAMRVCRPPLNPGSPKSVTVSCRTTIPEMINPVQYCPALEHWTRRMAQG